METKNIDATGKKIGRVATEAAAFLLGKSSPSFVKNKIPSLSVHIKNASLLDVNEKQLDQKVYRHYTGHPGGLREKTLRQVVDAKGYSEVLRKAVYGMLPGNKLRSPRMNRLIIEE